MTIRLELSHDLIKKMATNLHNFKLVYRSVYKLTRNILILRDEEDGHHEREPNDQGEDFMI